MESIQKNLEETIVSLLSKNANITADQGDMYNVEFKSMGLSSLDIIKMFIDLEKAGFIKLSALGNNEPPRTVNEMIHMCNELN
ncbi:hypothetical protein [Kordia jejudonensis]|uniref:hypothetical protein n=1 Tax=Kordia jejudonensis TaxID=1348245 RepID=UPI00062998FB|nr:hypothetical protein [Kordia jejudonensis]